LLVEFGCVWGLFWGMLLDNLFVLDLADLRLMLTGNWVGIVDFFRCGFYGMVSIVDGFCIWPVACVLAIEIGWLDISSVLRKIVVNFELLVEWIDSTWWICRYLLIWKFIVIFGMWSLIVWGWLLLWDFGKETRLVLICKWEIR